MQGILFHDEKANPVSNSSKLGQSQSKTAKYFRDYRRDPQKNRKINESRRRNRKMKMEQIGKLAMFQVPAEQPGKVSQQAVGSTSQSQANRPSLSDLWAVTSWEFSDSSRNHCQEDRIPIATTGIEKFVGEKTNKHEGQNQADFLHELRDSFRGIHAELKALKPTAKTLPINLNPEQRASFTGEFENANSDKLAHSSNYEKRDFLSGIFSQLAKIDGASFIKNFPAALALGYCAFEACKFVVAQTLPMYQSLKFPDPELACYGAISLAVGFSVLSAISNSSLARLFTAIIIAYEVILVMSGTNVNQSDIASQALRANREHYEALETFALAKEDYERYKGNYQSKESRYYKNTWYKTNHVDPAKKKMSEASSKLSALEINLNNKYSPSYWELVLKVLFRLSAVAFLMLVAKESIKRGIKSFHVYDSHAKEA